MLPSRSLQCLPTHQAELENTEDRESVFLDVADVPEILFAPAHVVDLSSMELRRCEMKCEACFLDVRSFDGAHDAIRPVPVVGAEDELKTGERIGVVTVGVEASQQFIERASIVHEAFSPCFCISLPAPHVNVMHRFEA